MKSSRVLCLAMFSAFINAAITINLPGNKQLVIEEGNIINAKVEAIVNAANAQLAGGAGVCGAIFDAAGKGKLQAECNKYPADNGVRCPTGQAKITSSGNLASKGINHIIHAVGPDCNRVTDEQQQDELLRSAYIESLKLATDNGITSIAFPFISSAIYAFPKERASQVALNSVKDYVKDHQTTLTKIVFVLFGKDDYNLFVAQAQKIFQSPPLPSAKKTTQVAAESSNVTDSFMSRIIKVIRAWWYDDNSKERFAKRREAGMLSAAD